MNWIYYKSNRSILIAVLFHITAGTFNEMFQTHPMSKVIQTGLLLVLTVVLLVKDRAFFFSREETLATDSNQAKAATVKLEVAT